MDHILDVIEGPCNSPDLNPVKNFWGRLKRHISYSNKKKKNEKKYSKSMVSNTPVERPTTVHFILHAYQKQISP